MVYVYYMSMKLIQINLTEEMVTGIDRAIELGYTTNRSEFIRSLIGEKLNDLGIITEMKQKKEKKG